jgi:TPR repeat protein
MSYRFLLTMAFISLLLSGVSGWIFFGEREKDPETLRILAYKSELIVAKKAADAGDESDITTYAKKLLYAPDILKDEEKAWSMLQRVVKQGYVPAQVQIGVMYADGVGVEQNNHRAVEWFKLATRLSNNPEANFYMGEAYFRGLGVPQDYGNAVPHYEKVARGGHPIAQYIVGTMYESGWGLRQDMIRAWVAYRLAQPFTEEIAAHEEGYNVETAIKRVEALMNHSQLEKARERLSALQS